MKQVSKKSPTFEGRKSNKFYQDSLIQVNLSIVVKESSLHQQFLQLQNQLLQIHWSLFWDCWENVTNLTVTIVQTYKYYSGGIFIPIFGLIGIIGNIFTLTVRSRPKFKDCFHKLLFSLACYDTIFIICGGINYTCRIFDAGFSIYTDMPQKL